MNPDQTNNPKPGDLVLVQASDDALIPIGSYGVIIGAVNEVQQEPLSVVFNFHESMVAKNQPRQRNRKRFRRSTTRHSNKTSECYPKTKRSRISQLQRTMGTRRRQKQNSESKRMENRPHKTLILWRCQP